jgi:nucleoside-diphosphate-sugar epimerase
MTKPNTIAVLGGSGVYARHLLPRLVAAGYTTRALVRRPETADVARACGADIRTADIFDKASLIAALEGCDVAINLATSLPGPSGRGTFEANDHLRRDGTPIWFEACREAGVLRTIQQSIAMLSSSAGDSWSDEDSPGEDSPAAPIPDEVAARAAAAALAMEQVARGSGLDCLVLRGALFYGPGTGFDDDWFARARAGKLRMPGDGSGYVSLVHIADMAAATIAALERWPEPKTLIIADDRPVTWRELFTFIAQSVGAAAPAEGGRIGFPSFRVRNTKAREALAWSPFYADYRAGLSR